jgi:hypothetical protein
MPEDPEKLSPKSADLDERRLDHEISASDRELELKKQDLVLRERELKKPFWHDSVTVGLVAAILALIVNLWVAHANKIASDATAIQNARLQSILEVIHNEPSRAEAKLNILLTTGIIQDKDGQIRNAVNSGLFAALRQPTSPESTPGFPGSGSSSVSPAPNPSGSSSGKYEKPLPPQGKGGRPAGSTSPAATGKPPQADTTIVQAEKTVVVAPGGYATVSNPPCADGNFSDLYNFGKLQFPTGVDQLTSASKDDSATCVAVKLEMPGATMSPVFLLEASEDGQSWKPCDISNSPWEVCQIGWSAWAYSTIRYERTEGEGPKAATVVAIFKNWSHDRTRKARINVLGSSQPERNVRN